MIDRWEYLDKEVPRKETYGCVYNTLTFLEVIPKDVGEHLTKLANQKTIKEGTTSDEFYQLMHEYYNDMDSNTYHFALREYPLTADTWMAVDQYLRPSEGTFIWLQRSPGVSGHAVVLAKNNSNQLVILDPQQGKIREYADFDGWFQRIGVSSILFVTKTKTNKRTYQKTKRKSPTPTPSIEKPQSKRARRSSTPPTMRVSPVRITFTDTAKCATKRLGSKPKSRSIGKPFRSKTKSRSKSKTRTVASLALQHDELCIVILSHGAYMTVDKGSIAMVRNADEHGNPIHSVENIAFSRFPIYHEHEGKHNMDIPETNSFTIPENVILYQYTNPETVLTTTHVDYIRSHLGSGKCAIPHIPTAYSIYVKPVPSSTRADNGRQNVIASSRKVSPDIQILSIQTHTNVTSPGTSTTNLELQFDTSVPSYAMGYSVTDHQHKTEMIPMNMTYTSLRNVLYDLSAKYPDKKLYIHQLSCRVGNYSDYKDNLRELKQLIEQYGESDRISTLVKKIYAETGKKKAMPLKCNSMN